LLVSSILTLKVNKTFIKISSG